MSSYDVKAHFTSVPMDPALDIIHGRLQQDHITAIGLLCPSTLLSLSWSSALKLFFHILR